MPTTFNVGTTPESSPALTEVKFKNVLLATDFSAASKEGLKTAIAIAKRFDSKVFIVHASQSVFYPAVYPGLGGMPVEPPASPVPALMEEFASYHGLRCVKHQTLTRFGSPVTVVNDVVREQSIDLVVVSSHGATGADKVLFGSVAENLVRHANCPVMVVGPRVKTEHMQYSSILLATDLSPAGIQAARYAIALARDMGSRITLLHVVPEPLAERSSAYESACCQLKALLPSDAECWCEPKLRVEVGDPAEEILEAASQDEAELIVMAVEHGLLADHAPWATFSRVVREAKCPVLGYASQRA